MNGTATSSLDPQRVSTDSGLLQRFSEWKFRTGRSAVVVISDNGRRHKAIPLRLASRWFPIGLDNQRKKLKATLDKNKAPGVLLTLTVDPAEYLTIEEAVYGIWPRWAAFRDTLNQRLVRSGASRLRYVAVLEFTKRGWPHLHVWLPNRRYLAKQKELQNLWGSIVDVRLVSASAAGYVGKYLRKLHKLPTPIAALLWKHRTRTYAVSPSLREPPPPPVTLGWEVIGFLQHRTFNEATSGLDTFQQFARDPPKIYAARKEDKYEIWWLILQDAYGETGVPPEDRAGHKIAETSPEGFARIDPAGLPTARPPATSAAPSPPASTAATSAATSTEYPLSKVEQARANAEEKRRRRELQLAFEAA